MTGNERQGMLIDGPAMGSIGLDPASSASILQQNLSMGGAQPTLGIGMSPPAQPTRAFAVPEPLTAPAALPQSP